MPLNRTILLFLALIFASPLHAQKAPPASAFFSVDGGIYVVPADFFEDTYGTPYGSILGASVGFPLSRRLYMFGIVSYFFKDQGRLVDMKMLQVGFKYGIPIPYEMTVDLLGGIARLDGNMTYPNSGNPPGKAIGNFLFGGFGGIGLEKKLPNFPVVFTTHAIRNMRHEEYPEYFDDFSGMRLTLGVRYYLPPPGSR